MHNQDSFFSAKIQEIQARLDGSIESSSDTLFSIDPSENIFDLHPFFESLKEELQNGSDLDKSLAFPCVHLDRKGKELICDITIKKDRGHIAVLLFDYSKHYENLHEAAQEKKTAMLNEQESILTQRHLEERKAYLGFMKHRIESKMIVEIEDIMLHINQLKHSELDEHQQAIVENMEEAVGKFHLKAMQIKNELDFDFDT